VFSSGRPEAGSEEQSTSEDQNNIDKILINIKTYQCRKNVLIN
jgi:hypothetical protein